MFEKQNQKHRKICFISLLTVIPSPLKKGNANGALLVLKVKPEIMWSWDC